jgi:hypothetical protein
MKAHRWVPYAGLGIFLILIPIVTNIFEPIIRDDPQRNIQIPKTLMHKMEVKAAYNDKTMFFRFKLPTDEPSWYHDYWLYQDDGRWHRRGRSPVGREPDRVYEDRIAFFLDDGRVPDFGRWGGFITVSSEQMRFFSEPASEQVKQHWRYGPRGLDDLRKWLPETRTNPHDWKTVKPEEELLDLQRAGYFLDLWQWRSHRSNPIGFSDDQYILDYRWSDEGVGMYTTNWDVENDRPQYMFDPEKTGQFTMEWDKVQRREYAQQDYLRYALVIGDDHIQGNAVPFDPDRDWKTGDVIPRRLLRTPSGSRGTIRSNGIYRDGAWHVDLWRALDSGYPLDDKILHHKGKYQIAFSAHICATGSRWHYISFPMTLGLDREADLQAVHFDAPNPPWDRIPWEQLTLFYPGQIEWSHLISDAHAGAHNIARGEPIRIGHDETVLAGYAVQSQFRPQIRAQWLLTLGAILVWLICCIAAALITSPRHTNEGKEDLV